MRWWRSQPEWVRDAAAATSLAALSLIPALRVYGLVLGGLPQRPADPLYIALILAQTLPLTLRRRAPAGVLATIGVAFALDQCLGYPPSPAGLGLLVALYSAGAHQQRRRRSTAIAAAIAYAALATALLLLGSPESPWDFATFAVVLAAAWGAGEVVRLRGIAARSRADEAARTAVIEQRDELARELHDVVGHHVTSMIVQADAAALLVAAGQTLPREHLTAIGDGGRRALADLRELLDVLGPAGAGSGERTPTIGSLDDLVAASAPQRVTLDESGTPTGSDQLRLTVYRIVQESLTNARKHAAGAPTEVRVEWATPAVHVRITTEASLGAPSTTSGSGRGIAGLRERAVRLGGQLHAGMDPAGCFVLDARLPLRDEQARYDG